MVEAQIYTYTLSNYWFIHLRSMSGVACGTYNGIIHTDFAFLASCSTFCIFEILKNDNISAMICWNLSNLQSLFHNWKIWNACSDMSHPQNIFLPKHSPWLLRTKPSLQPSGKHDVVSSQCSQCEMQAYNNNKYF